MKLREIDIEPDLILAPIAGFTDTYFRRMIKHIGGCGLIFSEMVSSEALSRDSRKSHRLIDFSAEERPIVIQISGADPKRMAEAAKIIEANGADAVDINMGCPSRNVTRSGAGSALIMNPALAARIMAAVRESVSVPVTVKIRSGWQSGDRKGIALARAAEECGASAVTVHPRARHDSFKKKAEWAVIGEIKSLLKIPVIGNGDVKAPEDAVRMKNETGCDAVMIGRAAIFNPWIFRQVAQMRNGESPGAVSAEERKKFALEYLQMVLAHEEGHGALHRMRSFSGWYFKGMPGALHLRRSLSSMKSAAEFFESALEYLS